MNNNTCKSVYLLSALSVMQINHRRRRVCCCEPGRKEISSRLLHGRRPAAAALKQRYVTARYREVPCCQRTYTVHLFLIWIIRQKLTDFNDFWHVNSEKIWQENLTDLSTSPVTCSHFILGNPEKSFSTVLFIRTCDYLRYLKIKQTATHLPTTPKKCHRTN